MGACASKFKVLKSAGDADPPEDMASRDLKPAEDLVKDTETPATVDDEPKRQMLGNLLKAVWKLIYIAASTVSFLFANRWR